MDGTLDHDAEFGKLGLCFLECFGCIEPNDNLIGGNEGLSGCGRQHRVEGLDVRVIPKQRFRKAGVGVLGLKGEVCHVSFGERRVVGELGGGGKLGGEFANTGSPGDHKVNLRLKELVVEAGSSISACPLPIEGKVISAEFGEVAASVGANLGHNALKVEWVADFLHAGVYFFAIQVAAVFDADKVGLGFLHGFRAGALLTRGRACVVFRIAAKV